MGDNRFKHFLARQAVTTIADTEKARNVDVFQLPLDDLALVLGEKIYKGFSTAEVWGILPSTNVIGIIDAVKNRVLELTSGVGKKYPNAGDVEGMDNTDQKIKNNVQASVNNVIYGNVGFLGNANHSLLM